MNLSELDLKIWRRLDWDALADRPAGVRRASIFALGLLAALLLGLLGVWWLGGDLAAEAGREQSLRARLEPQRAAAATLPALRQQQTELDQALAALEPVLADAAGASALWQRVQALAQAQSLQLDALEPGMPLVQPDYATLPATLRLRGSYAQLTRFAASLATGTPALHVSRWTLVPGSDGRLMADIALVGYQRLGERRAGVVPPATPKLPLALLPSLSQALAQLGDPFAAPAGPQVPGPSTPFQLATTLPPGPLVGVPLRNMTLVGTLAQDAASGQSAQSGQSGRGLQRLALLRVDGRVYTARVGDALGVDQGEVLRIEPGAVVVREWLRQSSGALAPRESRLALGGAGS